MASEQPLVVILAGPKVVWIPPEEIIIPPSLESSETNGAKLTPESE